MPAQLAGSWPSFSRMKASKSGLCIIGMTKTSRLASSAGMPIAAPSDAPTRSFFVPGFGKAKENWAMV